MRPIRVLVVDDHALFRSGIKALLSRQSGFEVVGEARDGLEGVKRAAALRPDVVLLDLHMPGMSGREAVKLLAEEVPQARVVMLTVSEDAEDLLETLQAGAHGYLLKNIDTEFLVQSIRRAAAGDSPVSEEMTGKLVQGVKARAGTAEKGVHEPERLTPRERDILARIAQGASNKEIGRDLDLAESTVKIHVRHILRKLNLASRVQAAVYAVEHGIGGREP
ncbi:MAG: response regulator [Burkholderiales bacterium]|nr:response regulator [Burkholderiales bacterium]